MRSERCLWLKVKRARTFIGEVWQLLNQHLPRPDLGDRWQFQLVAGWSVRQPQVELCHVGVEGLQLGTACPAAVNCRANTQFQWISSQAAWPWRCICSLQPRPLIPSAFVVSLKHPSALVTLLLTRIVFQLVSNQDAIRLWRLVPHQVDGIQSSAV